MEAEVAQSTDELGSNRVVSLEKFPLVIATMPAIVDGAALDELFEGVSRAERRKRPYVLLTDASRVERFAIADAMTRILDSVRVVASVESCATAAAMVAPTLALRTMIRVARLASPSPIPRRTFQTVHAALEWTAEMIDAMERSAS